MSEAKTIRVRRDSGTTTECSIQFSEAPPWKLKVFGLGEREIEFVGEDLFEAQIALRRELEKTNSQLLCIGARPEAFPSGMSRSMGGGRMVYIHRLEGADVTPGLYDMFADAEPHEVGTVAEQELFRQRWIEFVKRRV